MAEATSGGQPTGSNPYLINLPPPPPPVPPPQSSSNSSSSSNNLLHHLHNSPHSPYPPPPSIEDSSTLLFSPQPRSRSNTWPCRPPQSSSFETTSSSNYSTILEDQQETSSSSFLLQQHLHNSSNSNSSTAPTSNLLQQQQKKTSSRRNAWGNLSYADLITQAISSSPEKRLTLSQIYDWMVGNVPYFKDKGDSNSSAGWKNSIRHNLSLHNRFVRVQNEGTGKSSWWMLNPDAKPGKAARRRAASMETSKFSEKRRGRIRKRIEAVREKGGVDSGSIGGSCLSLIGGTGSEGETGGGEFELFPGDNEKYMNQTPHIPHPLHHHQFTTTTLSPLNDFRPRSASNASSIGGGRVSPPLLLNSHHHNLHHNQDNTNDYWTSGGNLLYNNDLDLVGTLREFRIQEMDVGVVQGVQGVESSASKVLLNNNNNNNNVNGFSSGNHQNASSTNSPSTNSSSKPPPTTTFPPGGGDSKPQPLLLAPLLPLPNDFLLIQQQHQNHPHNHPKIDFPFDPLDSTIVDEVLNNELFLGGQLDSNAGFKTMVKEEEENGGLEEDVWLGGGGLDQQQQHQQHYFQDGSGSGWPMMMMSSSSSMGNVEPVTTTASGGGLGGSGSGGWVH